MNPHDRMREVLPLAAASVLPPEEARAVARHATECPACAAELRAWEALAEQLDALPAATAPAGLAARTAARTAAAIEARAERRWETGMAAALALFAWALGVASWAVLRLVSAGPEALLEMRLPAMLASAALATALTWLTVGVAAFMLGRRRAAWRKI